MPKETLYGTEGFTTWKGLYDCYAKRFSRGHRHWIFKGHANADWHLRTTLERAFLRHFGDRVREKGEEREERLDESYRKISKGRVGDKEKRPLSDVEKGLLRDFKRKCHHHLQDVPPDGNALEWLTLMQHYGAPTRLLDFTYSFFVALYFAVEDADEECAVWAIDDHWLTQKNKNSFRKPADRQAYSWSTKGTTKEGHEKFFKRYFWKNARQTVDAVSAYRLNQRLIIQQGVFLCPGDISVPFMENLDSLFRGRSHPDEFIKLKIALTTQERRTVLQHLHQMNITRATLYPGLDGFAKSLGNLLIFPDILKPEVD
jgi:hypothetical protein